MMSIIVRFAWVIGPQSGGAPKGIPTLLRVCIPLACRVNSNNEEHRAYLLKTDLKPE